MRKQIETKVWDAWVEFLQWGEIQADIKSNSSGLGNRIRKAKKAWEIGNCTAERALSIMIDAEYVSEVEFETSSMSN